MWSYVSRQPGSGGSPTARARLLWTSATGEVLQHWSVWRAATYELFPQALAISPQCYLENLNGRRVVFMHLKDPVIINTSIGPN